MKLRSATLSSLIFVSSLSSAQQTGAPAVKGDQLVSYDSTRQWHYPYEVSSERRQQFVDALKGFQASSPLRDLTQQMKRRLLAPCGREDDDPQIDLVLPIEQQPPLLDGV